MSRQKAPKESKEEQGPSSKDAMASLLEEHKDDHFNNVKAEHKVISTGSLLLDSYVKIRSGSVVRLSGLGAELGKSSEALVLATNYMATMPKSKTIFVKAEARLSEDLKARTGLRYVTEAKDWDYGTVLELSMNKFEKMASILETMLHKMHENGEYLCIIIDSLDGLMLTSDAEKNVWGGDSPKVAGVPLLTKLLFRRIALPITHFDALLIITSQYSTPIALDPYSPQAPRQISGGGGSSAMHQSDYVFEMGQRYQGDMILENPDQKPDTLKNKIIGVWATYIIKKSGTDVTGAKVKVPIKKGRVGSAIWTEREVVDMCISWPFVVRKGAWFAFNDEIIAEAKEAGIELKPQIQGLNAFYSYAEDNPDVCRWLVTKFRSLIGIEIS